MTRGEFESFMEDNGWDAEQRALWRGRAPTASRAEVTRRMCEPGGYIEITERRSGRATTNSALFAAVGVGALVIAVMVGLLGRALNQMQ